MKTEQNNMVGSTIGGGFYQDRSWLRFEGEGAGGAGAGGAGAGAGGAAGGGAGAAGAGGGGGGQQQQQFQPPAGHRLVSEADWNAREAARTAAERYGKLGKPEEVEQFAPLLEAMRAGKFNPKMVAAMLADPASGQNGQQGGQNGQGKQLSQEEMLEQLRNESRLERAQEEWERGVGSHKALIDAQLKVLMGEGASPEELELWGYAANGALNSHRATLKYPDGHPLAGRYLPPLDGENSKPIWEKLTGLRTKLKGNTLSKIGEAANRQQGRGTPAGNSNAQGKADSDDKKGGDSRKASLAQSDKEIEEAINAA